MISTLIKDTLRLAHIKYLRARAASKPQLPQPEGATLIVAPHPDDEVIGCGGLIARLVSQGNPPYIVIMTGGEGSHNQCCSLSSTEIVNARRGLTRDALEILGVPPSNIRELDFPDGGIDAGHRQVAALRSEIEEIRPDCVFIPHWGEGWPDHVNTALILKSILPADTEVWEYCVWMWFYNVWSGLDWKNARLLKLTPSEHSLKLRAIDAYTKPLAPCGRPWSGVLPPLFLKANRWDNELYFKIR